MSKKNKTIFQPKRVRHQDINKDLEAVVSQYCAKFLSNNAAQMMKENLSAVTSFKPSPYNQTSFFGSSASMSEGRDLFKYSIKQTLGSLAHLLEKSLFRR